MISEARLTALKDSGQTPPEIQKVRGLIDTGASISGVDPSVLQALNLTPTGEIGIHTPSTQGVAIKIPTYDVVIGVYAQRPGDGHFVSETIQVVSTVLANQGVHVLIGRDILRSCILNYNGADSYFSISY